MDHLASAFLGLGNGAVFAALALALVLTYRSSGVLNFATGSIALFGAYTYDGLRDGDLVLVVPGLPTRVDLGDPLPFPPAAAAALIACGLLGALLYLAVFRPLRNAPPLAKAVASLAVLVILQELMALRLGTAPVSVPAIFPVERWELGGLTILSDRFYLAASVVVLGLGLAAAFQWTAFGLATRAAAESEVGSYVSGVSPDRIALANWILSAVVAGAAGILIAPVSPLTPLTYTSFVVPAMAAAVIGRFQNILTTVAAGLAVGMLQAESIRLAGQHSWMPHSGSSEMVPLLIILVALVLGRYAVPQRGRLHRHPLGHAPRPRSLLLPTVIGTAIGFVALLATSGTWRAAVIGTFIAAVIALSLVVVTGYAGQISVAQLSLAGAGAFLLSGVTASWGVPFPVAPLLAAAFTSLIGVVVGLPALRLRGLGLGVVTLAFAFAIEAVWFRNTDIVPSGGARVEQPQLLGLDLSVGTGAAFPRLSFGLLCLAVLVAVALGVAMLRRSALGSAMLAVRANQRSAAGLGVNPTSVKVAAFAISSFIAGLGGSLLAYRQGVVSFESYTALGNLAILSTAYLAGVTSVFGGISAGMMAASGIIFTVTDRWIHVGQWFGVISGVLLLVTLITHPEGLASGGHAAAARIEELRRAKRRASAPSEAATGGPEAHVSGRVDGAALEVVGATVTYGAVVALRDVSLKVAPGSVVGLIGPNGAGKTTLIDQVTGFCSSEGIVRLGDEDLSRLPSHRRVRRGVTRTFQAIELYDDLTVEENMAVAAALLPAAERKAAIDEALALVDAADLRERTAGELSQGQRQLVSIARACATRPSILLLDEPAAGLDSRESAWLGERIQWLARAGIGVLLVDHDVELVLSICSWIYVLDLGLLIAEGDAATIRGDEAVATAYLGSAEVAGEVGA